MRKIPKPPAMPQRRFTNPCSSTRLSIAMNLLEKWPMTTNFIIINRLVNEDVRRFDLNSELPKYHFPVLVGCGRFDMNVAPLIAWNIHQTIPSSQFVVFEKSGHIPFFEEPDKFVQVVDASLSH